MKLWKTFKIIFFNFESNSEHHILDKNILRTAECNSSKIFAGMNKLLSIFLFFCILVKDFERPAEKKCRICLEWRLVNIVLLNNLCFKRRARF